MKKQIIAFGLVAWLLLSLCVIGAETTQMWSAILCPIGGIISAFSAVYVIYRADKAGWLPRNKWGEY